MTTWDLDLTINRLLLGKLKFIINDRTFVYKNNDLDNKYEISLLIKDFYEKSKYDFFNKDQLEYIYIRKGLLDPQYKTKTENIQKNIENLKYDLFMTGPRVERAKRIRKQLEFIRREFNKHLIELSKVFYYSFEETCDRLRVIYNIIFGTEYSSGQKVFNLGNIDYSLLKSISEKIQENSLSTADLRRIARSNEWRSYWIRGKETCFKSLPSELNDEQKLLASYSTMYENALSRGDFPENIIYDDDKFDGWMIKQRRDAEDALKEQNTKKTDKHYNHVFKMAETQEEANNIYAMNPSENREILRLRAKELQNGPVKVFKDMIGK